MLRRTSNQWPHAGSWSRTRATLAQSYSLGPLAPSPAESRSQASSAIPAATRAAGTCDGPRSVRTHTGSLLFTARTKGCSVLSSHILNPRSPPYTSSPVTQAARTPASRARSSIASASRGLLANSTSSGTPASARRPAVLPPHPRRLTPLLHEAGLIDHQDGAFLAQVVQHVLPEIVPNLI